VDELQNGAAQIRLSTPNDPVARGYMVACVTLGGGQGGTLPGDCNMDRNIDLSDAVCLLGFLFLGNPSVLQCGEPGGNEPDASDIELLDADGNGSLDLTDPVKILNYLFFGGPPHSLGLDCVEIDGCRETCAQ
ncbi:MAG: hypothetical protein AAF517_11260, partial [Planctomycetota bacterium]